MNVKLEISSHILGMPDLSDTPLALAEEDGQLNYSTDVQTSRDAGEKKTTLRPQDTTMDVDFTASPDQRQVHHRTKAGS